MDNNQETKKGWLTAKLENWEFRRLYERELVAESFITRIEDAMDEQTITKTELAKRMECSVANISRAMRKTTNMTIATMVDMGLSLNLRVKIELEPMGVKECAFTPHAKPVDSAWSPPCSGGVAANVQGYMRLFRANEDDSESEAEAAYGGTAASRPLWSQQSAYDAAVPLPA